MSLENQKLPGTAIEANSISELELSSNLLSLIQSGVGPKVISYSFSSGNTLNDVGGDTVTLTGSNFDSNIEISIDGNIISNLTVTNSSSLSFTTQQFSNTGNFLIFLRNPDGSSTIAVPEIEVIQYVYTFQGTVSGYTSGGGAWVPPSIVFVNTIDKFPFASDANATDVGDLSQAREDNAGQSSGTNGYTSGGFAPPRVNTIDKFPFASDSNATDVGNLSQTRSATTGQSSSTNGYTSGGFAPPRSNVIDKFPFASDANATDVGDLTFARSGVAGQSSNTNGYTCGGYVTSPSTDPSNYSIIDKFPFASDANATDVGDMTTVRNSATGGQSSESSGYITGGNIPGPTPVRANIIEKFSFASDGNTTDVGDLTEGRYASAGQSSSDNGYTSGGVPVASYSFMFTIDKFPFATDSNATDVGDLTQGRRKPAGQQV